MLLQNRVLIIMLCISLVSMAAALHYKNSLDRVTMRQKAENKNLLKRLQGLSQLSRDIRIATYPTVCDTKTKAIIGEACDLGNYMEWAGPELEQKTGQLLDEIERSQTSN